VRRVRPDVPEISPVVFEELLVNALMHRDYLISAPIRLFIFDNRIEIISRGHLPNNLTVAKIRAGNSNIRNPILVSYIAKGLLPYRGLGSGIKRPLEDWPDIDFTDDREGCLFTATVGEYVRGYLGPRIKDRLARPVRIDYRLKYPRNVQKIGTIDTQEASA